MKTNDELSFEIINLYVKKNCKKCLGRGYRIWEAPQYNHGLRHDESKMRYGDYCDCVKRGLGNND